MKVQLVKTDYVLLTSALGDNKVSSSSAMLNVFEVGCNVSNVVQTIFDVRSGSAGDDVVDAKRALKTVRI